jgi:hypothetical protein
MLPQVPLAVISFNLIPVFQSPAQSRLAITTLDFTGLQDTRWIETFPIARGLEGLIWKLGFNQNSFFEKARR